MTDYVTHTQNYFLILSFSGR